jgi:hypothetical protein
VASPDEQRASSLEDSPQQQLLKPARRTVVVLNYEVSVAIDQIDGLSPTVRAPPFQRFAV